MSNDISSMHKAVKAKQDYLNGCCRTIEVSEEFLHKRNSATFPSATLPFVPYDDNIKEIELLREINKLMNEEAENSDIQWSKQLQDKVKLHIEFVNKKEEQ